MPRGTSGVTQGDLQEMGHEQEAETRYAAICLLLSESLSMGQRELASYS